MESRGGEWDNGAKHGASGTKSTISGHLVLSGDGNILLLKGSRWAEQSEGRWCLHQRVWNKVSFFTQMQRKTKGYKIFQSVIWKANTG